MGHTLPSACRRRPSAFALLAFSPFALHAQITPTMPQAVTQAPGQPPSNYHGPNLFGVCVYIVADTSFYSNVFSTSGYFKFKAQQAFQEFATANAHGAPLRGSGCRWSTSQEEVTTQKDADKRLLGLTGRSAKGVETGWSFNPLNTAAATTGQTTTARANTIPTSQNTTQYASNPNRAATTTNPNTDAATTTNAATSTTNTATTPSSSTQQTVQNSLATSKATAASTVNDTVATTMGTVSAGANNALMNLFNHKPRSAATGTADPATAAPTSGATGKNPAPLGFQSTESPEVATAEAQKIEGLVADVSGHDIIINVGTQAGVHAGSKLAVMHAVRTVKDPSTGKVLRTVEDKVGELTIQNADATSAAGTFAGTSAARVGDTVRSDPP